MDVSRIEAYNPNKINWRNMTAKEILKYEKQGVEVPDVYVQWAHNFLQNVQKYDNDEVTYENAKAITRHQSNEAKTNENSRSGANTKVKDLDKPKETEDQTSEEDAALAVENANISTDSGDSESISTDNGTEAIQLTAAQTKRKDFQDKGVELREQATSFTQDSQTYGSQASSEISTMDSIESSSNNEIAELEGAMKELIAEADAKQQELRQNVDKINNEKSDGSTFAKIEKLQKELEQLGMSGQNEIAQSEGTLRGYSSDINAGQAIMLNAGDFGTETVDVGNELLSTTGGAWWFNIDRMIGQKAVNAGNSAIRKAQEGENAVISAQDTNNANIGRVSELKTSVTDKTGVDAQNAKSQGNASEQDPITGKEKEADKDIKTASNDGTDTTDKLHISIDELVKRKVRRGEYIKDA
ncbi:hypothetical protein J6O86_04710 [bacterium]|nr:hypothetical protein [bacterium]